MGWHLGTGLGRGLRPAARRLGSGGEHDREALYASVVLDGKIYAMGGYDGPRDGAHPLDTVEVYDPQTDSWQRMASMPQGLCLHAAAVMGSKIYLTGGETGDDMAVDSVYVYDPLADAWTQLASMGIARQEHASAAVGGKLYVFGGQGGEGRLSTAEVYDPASDSWAQATSLTSARIGTAAAAL